MKETAILSSNRSLTVEFGGKSEVKEDSESFGEDEKDSDQTTDQNH